MSDQADLYVMRPPAKQPCNDCPFRRNAVPGWLGPWQPDDLLFSLGRETFPCHQTIPAEFDAAKHAASMTACAGAAMFLNNKCERSRHPQMAAAQDAAKTAPAEIKATVFSNSVEFVAHHTRKPMRK